MEFVSSTISISPYISPVIPFSSPKFSIFTLKNKKNPFRLTISNSRKLPLNPSFSFYSFNPPHSRKFQISSHFGRPTKRQNYLRKKLTQQQQQRQQLQEVSGFQNPVLESDKVDVYESNLDISSEESKILEKMSSLGNDVDFDGSMKENMYVANNHESALKGSETELSRNKFGESIMWNKLESWVEQCKKDAEFWGVGSGNIFTIYQDSDGKVERVVVNEDEILRRSRVDRQLDGETEEFAEANFKISFANDLARDMKNGINVIPRNSSVAKFLPSGEVSNFTATIQDVKLKPDLFSKMSKVGFVLVGGLFMAWTIKGFFFTSREEGEEYTELEKEMLSRKMRARTEKENMVKATVEVVQDPVENGKSLPLKRPHLDQEELMNSFNQIKEPIGELGIGEYSGYQNQEFNDKIEEIRTMARRVREIEKKNSLREKEDDQTTKESSSKNVSPENDTSRKVTLVRDSNETSASPENDIEMSSSEALLEKSEPQPCDIPNVVTPNGSESSLAEVSNVKSLHKSSDLSEPNLNSNDPGVPSRSRDNSSRKKFRIIKSAKEAKEYLSRKHEKVEVNEEHGVKSGRHTDIPVVISSEKVASSEVGDVSNVNGQVCNSSVSGTRDISYSSDTSNTEAPEESIDSIDIDNEAAEVLAPFKELNSEDADDKKESIGDREPVTTADNDVIKRNVELSHSASKESWMEKNFHAFEPIVEKIGIGFRDNYYVAREKANQQLDAVSDITQIKSDSDGSELEWMKDERLREIVFKVRDNELSGRDPFHLMDEDEKSAFFTGLEKKVEQENEKLQRLHEYFHSNIENLDYGADGISLYDPPEKIIPRWKTPPAEKNPEFLDNFMEQRKSFVAESHKNSLTKKTGDNIVHESLEPASRQSTSVAADVVDQNTKLQKEPSISSKTIIEGSDGSVRAGKKSGKEYWQHTKKWSEGFLESYNAETDPEVKSVMRDMGKDLDRWITDKEIGEAAELMDKLPEKGQKFVKEKLDKVKREMELFGPQAVVSKYREYAEEKEEDYLWWLDLPYVLCIELYTVENGEHRVGFYSLEMAADLDLDPKQHHVIAFEDASDCKNLCYIIQSHLEMLGNGNSFVIARPPKDAFREAKENGFSVTVIRKGQLQLNIDQTLEEVEELLEEVGSKIYHDKIMKERSVDISGLMKGVFGTSNTTKRKRRSKRKLKKPSKP